MAEKMQTADTAHEVRVDRLLRCRQTKRYYAGRGQWSPEPRQALTFACELDAVRSFVVNGMKDVDLVLRVAQTNNDIYTTRLG